MEKTQSEKQSCNEEDVIKSGAALLENDSGSIFCLTIIGQIEGHQVLPETAKVLKEKDENFSGDDFQEGMYLVFNITAPGVSYDAQVKSRITKLDMKPFNLPIVEGLTNWLNTHEKDAKVIIEKALLARKAREKAKSAKEAVRSLDNKKKKVLKRNLHLTN